MSKLYYIFSAMNAGKTAELIQKSHKYVERNLEIRIMTSEVDTRYEPGTVTSRIGLSRPAITIKKDSTKQIDELLDELRNGIKIKAVFVDECQFLNIEQVDLLSSVVDEYDIPVYCYGIRTDFKTQLFEGSRRLFEIADDLEEIKGICDCGKSTKMNARLTDDNSVILVGGNDIYKSVCRKCYKKMQKGKPDVN